jgi:hypothetical protein
MAEGQGDSLELGPSSSKRKRGEPFLSPDDLSESDRDDLLKACFKMCKTVDPDVTVSPFQVTACNASVSSCGFGFSRAFCALEPIGRAYLLGDIFRTGLDMGIDFLEGKIPEANHERIILEKLIRFLKEGRK